MRIQGNIIFCLSQLFNVTEDKIYNDFMQLRELVDLNEEFADRSEHTNYIKGMWSFFKQSLKLLH